MMYGDTMGALGEASAWFHGSLVLSAAFALLLGPFLTGMTVATGRAGRALGFGQLMQSGVIEYGRMFRLLLWSLLPYAIAIGLGAMAIGVAHKSADHAVLQAAADRYQRSEERRVGKE